eukprot:NODE_3609_length_753_cov_75.311080_g3027_i0.p1 GENE.NODE_3609_length_753_cov_75.311080_g3027_i0~~NODE_3609_length_753_cov_75.311080_g3027_i0.p1  ORF type:complete len:97 (-),score=8.29 NODE_3609_length_753_cov_75.311080_g3027_i0:409-699(-)
MKSAIILTFSVALLNAKPLIKDSPHHVHLKAKEAHDFTRTKHRMESPRHKQFGYDTVLGTSELGAEIESNFDLGAGYKVIWETYEQFFIINPELFL